LTDAVEELAKLVPPPPIPVEAPIDWPRAEQSTGLRFPRDYRDLMDTYGVGCFDEFIWLLHPSLPDSYLELGRRMEVFREALRESQGTEPDQPNPEELIPWAFTENGDVCYWISVPRSEPDEWMVAVNESRGPAWDHFDKGAGNWLVSVLSGRRRLLIFPYDFPSQRPQFVSGEGSQSAVRG
jgi:SMI1-KNR4 cell-wall